MDTIAIDDLRQSLHDLLTELIDGGLGEWVFITDGPATGGFERTLARISGERAFAETTGAAAGEPHGPAAIASHVLYAADLFARALRGDHSGYAEADWSGSWVPPADVAEQASNDPAGAWAELSRRLMDRLRDARSALADCTEFDQHLTRTGAIGNVAHFAYHFAQLRRVAAMRETD